MQRDGATVFVQKTGAGSKARYNLVVDGEKGIVTGMRNLKKQEVKIWRVTKLGGVTFLNE